MSRRKNEAPNGCDDIGQNAVDRHKERGRQNAAWVEMPVAVLLTPGEIKSLLWQYKDGDLYAAERKLREAYEKATGEPWR